MNRVSTEVKASIEERPASPGRRPSRRRTAALEATATDSATITSVVDAPVLAVAGSADKATGVTSRSRRAQRDPTDTRRHDRRRAIGEGDRRQHHGRCDQRHGDRRTSAASAITVALSLRRSLAFSGGGAVAINLIGGHGRDDPGRHDDRDGRCARAEHAGGQGRSTISTTNSSSITGDGPGARGGDRRRRSRARRRVRDRRLGRAQPHRLGRVRRRRPDRVRAPRDQHEPTAATGSRSPAGSTETITARWLATASRSPPRATAPSR